MVVLWLDSAGGLWFDMVQQGLLCLGGALMAWVVNHGILALLPRVDVPVPGGWA